jgi:hypothetical protein
MPANEVNSFLAMLERGRELLALNGEGCMAVHSFSALP